MLWNLCEEISQLCSLGLSPKSSLVSSLIVFAFVHHLTEHISSWLLGSVKYRNKKNILFEYYVAINSVTHITGRII